ncbi:MAG: DNA-binding protein [Parafilimonas terrae]|nr:DNA-binding protein [Parafilimonas terrae]
MTLASGAHAVLSSLRWPDEDAAAHAWLDAFTGHRIALVPRGEADRWGRQRIDAVAEDSEADLAGGLIAAGLAYADPGEADSLCRPALRLVEAVARARGLGLWRTPPLLAEDGAALRRLAGRFGVVEGRIRHVGERSARTYLDFVPRGADGLVVIVTKRTWRALAGRGLTAATLRDRRVRVRGIIELWHGPTIEAATADAMEVLDDEAPGPESGPARIDSGVRR